MGTATRHSESTRGHIGQGLYSLADLRTYLTVSGTREDGERAYAWLSGVLNPVRRTPRRPDHSFSDLVSLFVVRELLRQGLSPSTIREGEQHLRNVWGTDRPFVYDKVQTDGRDIFADGAKITGQIEAATRSRHSRKTGQQVMLEVVKDLLRDVRYVDGQAQVWVPAAHVVIDPRVQFGEPVVEGTRVPTSAVADVAATRDPETAAKRFRLSTEQAASALSFERRLAATRN